jgi:hypothetical protein
VRLNQLLSVSSRLWVGGRWYSNATLRAYVDKDRPDDIEVGDLGTLVMQMKISVSSGKMKRREETEREQEKTYSESRELEPDNK